MPITVLTPAQVTVVSWLQFGGQSGKKRKRVVFTLADPTGLTIGGAVGDMPASAFGFIKVEDASPLRVYNTATGALLRVYTAAPDPAGTTVYLSDSGQAAGAVADAVILGSATESAQIILTGY